jgi:hypothetical protein
MSADYISFKSEAMDGPGGYSPPQSLASAAISTTDTPASSADVSDLLPHIDDVNPTVEELNAHRDSHDLVRLSQLNFRGLPNLGEDLPFDMDIVGTGEQFTDTVDVGHLLGTRVDSQPEGTKEEPMEYI